MTTRTTAAVALVLALTACQPQRDQPGTPIPADAAPATVKVVQP